MSASIHFEWHFYSGTCTISTVCVQRYIAEAEFTEKRCALWLSFLNNRHSHSARRTVILHEASVCVWTRGGQGGRKSELVRSGRRNWGPIIRRGPEHCLRWVGVCRRGGGQGGLESYFSELWRSPRRSGPMICRWPGHCTRGVSVCGRRVGQGRAKGLLK